MAATTAGERLRERLDAALVGGVEWDERESVLLNLASAQADDVDRLERLLATQGPTVTGSTGQERLNPVFTEVRQARLALSRLLQEVRLPDESTGVVRNVAKVRAARSRWDRRPYVAGSA